jgi:conjugal transfer pilus assembly protein TraF
MKALALSLVVSALVIPVPAWTQSVTDYTEARSGWFWYQDPLLIVIEPIDEEDDDEDKAIAVVEDAATERKALVAERPEFGSVGWLRSEIPVALQRALDDPSEDNIKAFAYMQRMAFDRAEVFARQFQSVVLSDPVLDENNRMPISTFARRVARRENEQERQKRLAWLAENAGFFYFHDENCVYCREQAPVLNRVASRHNLRVLAISMDGSEYEGVDFPTRVNDGHAERFQVEQVPALVMIWPPDNAAVISQGLLSAPDIENRMLTIAERVGLLTEEVDQSLGIERQKMLTDIELHELQELEDDPSAWVRRLRQEMGYE